MNELKYEIVGNTFQKTTVTKKNQILSSEIKKEGLYPVIDQGQDYIAGYCDDETKLVKNDLPYIIFGDHTRAIKYVDFPFIIGADGTQVLKPKIEFDPKYYYFALLFLNIPSRGYNRHFSILKEKQIPLPPLPTQRKIAHILSKVQEAIAQQTALIDRTIELKKAMMHKLFSEGTKGEKQKMTEIGLIPKSWEVVELGKYAKIKNGYAFKSSDYKDSGVLTVRISNVSTGCLINKDNRYLPLEYLQKYADYTLDEGDLILSLTRPIISTGMKYCFIKKDQLPLLLNQRVGKFEVKDSNTLLKDYLFYIVFSKYFLNGLKKLFGNSSQQPNVSPVQIEKFLIPLPAIDEQKKIFRFLNKIDKKYEIHNEKKVVLEALLRSLLNQMMSDDIDLDDIIISGEKNEFK